MLNRLRLPLVLALLVPAASVYARTVSREVEIPLEHLSIQERNGRSFLELRGSAHAMPEGAPDLPLVPVHIALPSGESVVSVRFVPLETRTLAKRPLLAVRGEGAALGDDIAPASWFPADPVTHVRSGRMRGQGIASVLVSPASWIPSTGEMRFATRFRVEVITEPSEPLDDDLVLQRESASGSRSFDRAIAWLTGTQPQGLHGLAELSPLVNSGAPFEPTFRPSVDGSPVEMVIITTPDQEAAYQVYADLKTKLGLSTVVRTVDWIRDNYPHGVDTQETIRIFIRDAIEKWGTAYVLLGGDSDQIPPRYGRTTFHNGEDIPADLYYAAVDGNWNGDGDALFGEGFRSSVIPGDAADLLPDCWVGRFPTNNALQAELLVGKATTYLMNPPLGYQNDYLYLGEVLFPQNWNPGDFITLDGAELCEDGITHLGPQHRPVRLYENHTAYPGAIYEDKATVVDSVDAGFHLVHHVGHGFINTQAVGGGTLQNLDAQSFTNGDELFLLYTITCTSGAIDFNCIAEQYLANPNGGAFAVIASSRLDFPVAGGPYQAAFYTLLFDFGYHELGTAFALAKAAYSGLANEDNVDRWIQFTHIYLGDPSIAFHTDVPEPLVASFPSATQLGKPTFHVAVTRGGSPAESVRVALLKDGDDYVVGTTDAAGIVDLPFEADETGSFSVGAYKENSVPFLGSAVVTVPWTAPHVFARSQGIVDDGSGGSAGNGDGKIDAGETVELNLTLENGALVTQTAVVASLSTTDPYLTILDDSAAYDDLPRGVPKPANDPFVIQVSPDAPERLEARCTLQVTGTRGSSSQEIILYIRAPLFEYRQQFYCDCLGNGNADFQVTNNEDFLIVPTLRNVGMGDAVGVEGRLRTDDPNVTITDSVCVLGDIPSGGIVTNFADWVSARVANVAIPYDIRLVVVDAYGELGSFKLNLVAPAQVTGLATVGGPVRITLKWNPIPDPDLWGYTIYRAPVLAGPFTRINLWTAERTSYYVDEGLPGLTRYYYRVAAIDSSGNEGALSVISSASTTLPMHEGFPVQIQTATTGGVAFADLDGDDAPEILTGGDEIYALRANGTDYHDGDQDVRTLGPLTGTGGKAFWNTPAIGDVDQDGDPEIAAVSYSDAMVHLVDALGEPLPGWPKNGNPLASANPTPLGSVCLADLDGNGDLEIVCAVDRLLFAWHYTGVEVVDGDANAATDGVLRVTTTAFSYGTPGVADIDGDLDMEIVAGMRDGNLYVFQHDGSNYPGFPFAAGGNITSSPAIADINNDGLVEMIFGSSNSQLHALRYNLTEATGYPAGIQLQGDLDSSPGLGDLNGDGKLDVVIGASNGALFAFSGANGLALPGFPVPVQNDQGTKILVASSPAVADVDADGLLDIVVGDNIGRLLGVNALGQPLSGFPIQTGSFINSGPAVWDTDGDGLNEILVQSFDQKLYCWDTPWAFNSATTPWPKFKHNQRNSGVITEPVMALVTGGLTLGAPGLPDVLLLENFPNPFTATTAIRYRVPEATTSSPVLLRIFDLRGRVIRTLVQGTQPPGLFEVRWDGTDDAGKRVASGIYPYRLDAGATSLSRRLVLLR